MPNTKQIKSALSKQQEVPPMESSQIVQAHPVSKQPSLFTKQLAAEIVKNLTSLGHFTTTPFRKAAQEREEKKKKVASLGEYPILIDTSVLIDGRIVPIVNSGFLAGTLVIPQFILQEVQHIADSSDALRRAKGRRGLEAVSKLKNQRNNDRVKIQIIEDNPDQVKEVDHKLVDLAKKWNIKLMTVDFNLAQLSRAQGIKVLNVNDLSQAIKVALMPGEEMSILISHEGKEREQGVGYLPDGTMVIVDGARSRVGTTVAVFITKVHQTPAGQLFFARLK